MVLTNQLLPPLPESYDKLNQLQEKYSPTCAPG